MIHSGRRGGGTGHDEPAPHHVACDMSGSNLRAWHQLLLKIAMGCMAVALLGNAARAACDRNPGDYLLWEDAQRYYCATVVSQSDVNELLNGLRALLSAPPSVELIGPRWNFRKAAIDAAGCLARNHTAYQYGAKWGLLDQCTSGKPIDCSGLTEHSFRSACLLDGFYSVQGDVLSVLRGKDAAGQAKLFSDHGGWIPKDGNPMPGDAVFFCCTNDAKRNAYRGITHAGIFLGRRADGTMIVIQAVSAGVKIGPLKTYLTERLVGFGNAGKLYTDYARPR